MKALLVFVAGSAAGLLLPHVQWKGTEQRDLPAVFQEIKTMGVLRTASVEASQVVSAQSSVKAPQAISWILGVPQALSALSRSEAGVQVTGRFEAGVDLAQAEFSKSSQGVLVRLPRAELVPGTHRTELLWTHESWLNRDRALPLKAQEQGREALMKSLGASQLLKASEDQAQRLIKDILTKAGADQVTIVWKPGSQSI